MKELNVRTFGSLVISTDDARISSEGNRSRKAWTLLGYLIYNRQRAIRKSELIELLWGNIDDTANYAGALKTLVYRLRSELNNLWDGAGHELLRSQGDTYKFDDSCPIKVDCEIFEKASDSLDDIMESLKLYRGGFLRDMESELWVVSLGAYYHNLYIERIMKVGAELTAMGRSDELLPYWPVVSQLEPYNEEVHAIFMKAFINSNRQKDAIDIYHKFKDRLLSDLGVLPSESVRALYYDAKRINRFHTLSIENIQEQLRENNSPGGALICEYDFFRVLYHFMARSVIRNGIAVHIALLLILDRSGEELNAKRLEKSMVNLEEVIRSSLRRGDVVSKCTSSQYIIMLPSANYENTCMVCERIAKAYNRKHPNSNTLLHYEICPIEPDEKDFKWIQN